MLPNDEMLKNLIRSGSSFMLYGQKASGKTTLMNQIFHSTGRQFIEINCTLVSRRGNFFSLFNMEMNQLLAKNGFQCEKLTSATNLDAWINDFRKVVYNKDEIVDFLNDVYVFVDSFEEFTLQEDFLPAVYTACQMQFMFRLSFVFCGINFKFKDYMLEAPFRTMPCFCMPKPIAIFNNVIEKTVHEHLQLKFREHTTKDMILKAVKSLSIQIRAALEHIEMNLQRIKNLTKSIIQVVSPKLDEKDPNKSLSRLIHRSQLKDIMQKAIDQGPNNVDDPLKRKTTAGVQPQQIADPNSNLQYYPTLILSSFFLAEYYNQKDDKRRFTDYKGRSHGRNRQLKRADNRITKHNLNRIIAIAEALESQAKPNDKQMVNPHHSLDFYSTFEHLRTIGRIKPVGGKIFAVTKEEQTRAFMSKQDLKYEQFMSN